MASGKKMSRKISSVRLKMVTSPHYGNKGDSHTNNSNPFNTTEKSHGATDTHSSNNNDSSDITSGYFNSESVDCKISLPKTLYNGASVHSGNSLGSHSDTRCTRLDTKDLNRELRLINRLHGRPSSYVKVGGKKSTYPSTKVNTYGKKLPLHQESIVKNDVPSLKFASLDTNTSSELLHSFYGIPSHEPQVVNTQTHDDVSNRSQHQHASDSTATYSIEAKGTNFAKKRQETHKSNNYPCGHNEDSECSYFSCTDYTTNKSKSSNLDERNEGVASEVCPLALQTGDATQEKLLENDGSSIDSNKVGIGNDKQKSSDHRINDLLLSVHNNLHLILNSEPGENSQQFQAIGVGNTTQMTVHVSRWHDYTSKHGFAYQLSNGSVGVMFNDDTNMTLLPGGTHLRFAASSGDVYWCKMGSHDAFLDKKIAILVQFKENFQKHQENNGEMIPLQHCHYGATPYLVEWYKDSTVSMMLLSNTTFQVDILNEDTKIIFCPGLTPIIFIGANKESQTIQLESFSENGCRPELARSLKYAYDAVSKIISTDDSGCYTTQNLTTEKRKIYEEMDSLKKLKTG